MIRLSTWDVHVDGIFGHDNGCLEQVEMCVYMFMHYFSKFLGGLVGLVDLCILDFSISHGRILGHDIGGLRFG